MYLVTREQSGTDINGQRRHINSLATGTEKYMLEETEIICMWLCPRIHSRHPTRRALVTCTTTIPNTGSPRNLYHSQLDEPCIVVEAAKPANQRTSKVYPAARQTKRLRVCAPQVLASSMRPTTKNGF